MLFVYMAIAFAIIFHFHRHHREAIWKDLEPPEDPDDIEDPLYRGVSKIRAHICQAGGNFTRIMDRATGEFTRPEETRHEPHRTERLLRHPLTLFHETAADALDAHKLAWLSNSSGFSWRGVFYPYMAFCVQLTITAAQAVGIAIVRNTPQATAQMCVIMSLQYGFAMWLHLVKPSADRVDNLELGTQYTIEGTQTLLFLFTDLFPEPDGTSSRTLICQQMAFFLALGSLFLPICVQVYDAIIVQISLLCRRHKGEEVSIRAACFALLALLLSIPGLLASLVGLNISSDTSQIKDGVAEAAARSQEATDDVVELAEMIEDLAEVAGVTDGLSELASDFFWAAKPMPQYHKAALKLQKRVRGNYIRRKLRKQVEDARTKEHNRAWLRGRPGFAWLESQLDADEATEKQIGERLRRARDHRSSNVERALSWSMTPSRGPNLETGAVQALRVTLELNDRLNDHAGIVYARDRPVADKPSLRQAALFRRRKTMSKLLPTGYPPAIHEEPSTYARKAPPKDKAVRDAHPVSQVDDKPPWP